MIKGKNNLPFGVDWNKIQENFIEDHFKTASRNSYSTLDLNWMEKYMNDVIGSISNTKNQNNQRGTNNTYEIFETYDYVIVKYFIPNHIHPKNIKVFLDINKLKIEGLSDPLSFVQLPVNCRYQGSRAIIKNEILEIRVQKDNAENYRELPIQFLK